jgi:hypothetical protein
MWPVPEVMSTNSLCILFLFNIYNEASDYMADTCICFLQFEILVECMCTSTYPKSTDKMTVNDIQFHQPAVNAFLVKGKNSAANTFG